MARGAWGGHVAAVLIGVMASFALVAGPAGPATAHDSLTASDPADGATVEVAPDRVTLTFTEPALELGTQVLVTGPDGVTVSEGPVVLDGTTVTQALLAERPAGAYRVDWRVTSEDGHPVSGTFTFTASTGVAPEPDPTPTPAVPSPSPAGAGTTSSTPAPEPSADPTAAAAAAARPGDAAEPARSTARDVLLAAVVLVLAGGVPTLVAVRRRAGRRQRVEG